MYVSGVPSHTQLQLGQRPGHRVEICTNQLLVFGFLFPVTWINRLNWQTQLDTVVTRRSRCLFALKHFTMRSVSALQFTVKPVECRRRAVLTHTVVYFSQTARFPWERQQLGKSKDTDKPPSKVKGKGFPYSLPNVGPGADPTVYRQSACR